ncbi:MAG: LLM class flavin-dependent oxidoreductase [Deltaproteobacteria bacterium]|nr:LLM class flavin-dependent oxidoreductase [Deltaproteobacteria bacterium]
MKVGTAISMLNVGEKPDGEIYKDDVRLGLLAEPLGFDSIWSVEHHFTGYAMVPNVVQLLTYFAGATKRVQLGTAVIVLPWHDPVRVAEEMSMLDNLSGGRTMFGFGRGAATVEYDGFRISMDEARARFEEAAKIVITALSKERFSYDGQFYKIPEMSIRPRPLSHPEKRLYASSVSPESAEIMAKLGIGVLIVPQKDWETTVADVQRYRATAQATGFTPKPPISLINVSVRESSDEALEDAHVYMGAMFDSIDAHYHFSDGHLQGVKGYEFYAKMAKTYSKFSDSTVKAKAVEFFTSLHVAGTPQQCLDKIAEIRNRTGMDHFVGQFSYGGMPYERGEKNMRLFAEKVKPVLQDNAAFPLFMPEAEARG